MDRQPKLKKSSTRNHHYQLVRNITVNVCLKQSPDPFINDTRGILSTVKSEAAPFQTSHEIDGRVKSNKWRWKVLLKSNIGRIGIITWKSKNSSKFWKWLFNKSCPCCWNDDRKIYEEWWGQMPPSWDNLWVKWYYHFIWGLATGNNETHSRKKGLHSHFTKPGRKYPRQNTFCSGAEPCKLHS